MGTRVTIRRSLDPQLYGSDAAGDALRPAVPVIERRRPPAPTDATASESVNVLEVNLALRKRYGEPGAPAA